MSINNHIHGNGAHSFFASDTDLLLPLHFRLAWAGGVLIAGLSFAYFLGNAEKFFPESSIAVSESVSSIAIPSEVKGTLVSVPLDYNPDTLMPTNSGLYASMYTVNASVTTHRVEMPINSSPESTMSHNYPESSGNPSLTYRAADDSVQPYLNPQAEKLLSRGFIRHTTVNGDKLDRLAEYYLKDASRWEEIYKINASLLTNKNVVPIGIVLLIPYPEQ